MEPEEFLKSFRLFVIPRFDEMFVDLLLAIIKVSVNEKSRVYRKKIANCEFKFIFTSLCHVRFSNGPTVGFYSLYGHYKVQKCSFIQLAYAILLAW